MDLFLQKGLKGSKQFTVDENSTATKYGSGLVEVFATPAMIALMETTALESVEQLLPSGYTTVGTEVCIKHLHASPVGSIVRCESKLLEINDKKLVFEVSVWEETILIGHGTHTRYVVNKERFTSKIKLK